MTSSARGATASPVEVGSIDRFGVWLLVLGTEYFLSHAECPWFRTATIAQILNVVVEHDKYVRWPDLDVGLELESLEHPESYPRIYR